MRTQGYRINRIAVLIAMAALVAVLAVFGGCSKPAVKFTAISGDVRQVQTFRVACDNVDQTSPLLPSEDIELQKTKYTEREYCTRFSEKVRRFLIADYGLTMADNFPHAAVIHLELHSEKLSLFAPAPDTTNLYNDVSPAEKAKHGDSEVNLVGAAASLFSDKDYVNAVRVRIIDYNGRLLGELIIGGEDGDHVEPKFVAKVIDEVIRTGQYKGSQGIQTNASGNVIP